MLSEIRGHVASIEYAVRGEFKVKLEGISQTLVATDTFNRCAIDAALERRASVVLELEGDRIRRVQSDLPEGRLERKLPGKTVLITRISTQVASTGELIVEVFILEKPGGQEEQGFTNDQTVHLLCHSAYVARRPIIIERLDTKTITAVQKE